MGYYVSTRGSNFTIPAEKITEADEALKKLNGYEEKNTAVEILCEVGYEDTCINADGDLVLGSYSGKTYEEDVALYVLAHLVKGGSYVNWDGEDGEHWQDFFPGDGTHIQKDGVVIYQ